MEHERGPFCHGFDRQGAFLNGMPDCPRTIDPGLEGGVKDQITEPCHSTGQNSAEMNFRSVDLGQYLFAEEEGGQCHDRVGF